MADSPPPLDAEVDKLDNYWLEDTTITVPRIIKANLDEHRDGQKWGPYLEKLRREYADPLTFNDVNEIAAELKNQISMANEPGVDVDTDQLIKRIESIESMVENVPEDTAEILGERYG